MHGKEALVRSLAYWGVAHEVRFWMAIKKGWDS